MLALVTLTSGSYELRDLKPGIGGNPFERKITVDKPWDAPLRNLFCEAKGG